MVDLKNYKILVTPTSFGKNDPRLKAELEEKVGEVVYNPTGKPLSSAEVARLLPGIDGYIAGLDVIDQKALASADRLKIIARYGVGVDNVDLPAAREKGIVVTNTPGANSVSVAELTVGLILALARQIPQGVSATRQGLFPRLSGLSIEGKTVGILGLGSIGKQVARRLCGFDCRILAYDSIPDSNFAAQYNIQLSNMDELLKHADYVSLHLPLLPETRGMVDRPFLLKVKQGAYIVNTARGELIDEAALLDALKSGHIRGAALDVFAQEPPPPDHPLLALPQVIATPHLGAQTDGAVNAMGWMSYHECMAVLSGAPVKYRIV
jgi:D-3-phosphoglycerate dehydrogenase